MTRRLRPLVLCLAVTALPVAGVALADDEPSPDERARQLTRDLLLIETLVDGSLKLAAEDDALRRADHCNRLADKLAREIKQAMGKKEAGRANQLSLQMQELLTRGVASNLTVARAELGKDSAREGEFTRLAKEADFVAKDLEVEAGNHPELNFDKTTIQAVSKGRLEIEAALKGKGKGPLKGKGPFGPPGKKIKHEP
jgi:hypothetical protein